MGLGAFLHDIRQTVIIGPVVYEQKLPGCAKDLLVTFYTLYFKHPLATAKSKTP